MEGARGFGAEFPADSDRLAMVLLTRKIEFSASHRYDNPAFSPEENRRFLGSATIRTGMGTTTRWKSPWRESRTRLPGWCWI